ncbi:protein CASC3 isoform X2 [Phyllopteryx taeniolatus]|uniref:protein CASC3 isoform X2 n=1 Tax=Phyllopteryx taeniolatus TaxID=161469 RepID=UPI002AD2AB7B|nr:protein CASC3 isoform X2 [Phyllopteryx taeniolatus]
MTMTTTSPVPLRARRSANQAPRRARAAAAESLNRQRSLRSGSRPRRKWRPSVRAKMELEKLSSRTTTAPIRKKTPPTRREERRRRARMDSAIKKLRQRPASPNFPLRPNRRQQRPMKTGKSGVKWRRSQRKKESRQESGRAATVRSSVSPNREPWWRDGGERAVRSWQSGRGGRGGGSLARGGPPHRAVPLVASQRGNTTRGRPPHLPAQPQYGGSDSHAPLLHPRERVGPKAPPVPAAAGRGSRRAAEDPPVSKDGEDDRPLSTGTQVAYRSTSPTQQLQEKRGGAAQPPHASVASQEASPPAERPVERKSYSLARRSRSRPAELGGKQTSVEEVAVAEVKNPVGGGGMAELDQDVARLSLVSGQSWNQNPASYVHSEIRSLRGGLPIPSGRPPFSGLDEMSGGSNRAKRYSSQRQRGVAEAAPLHIGVMEGHYYEPMTYQGPIFTHGEASAPVAPQGILVQPEMHIPHPGLHPHQSGGPIANPALYGGPPVSLPPGQPQQLLPPPFYPPPGVMTFPYPAMYPSPQGQSQVTYGGVTYYDTMQQQAQPKPSPPRRTSQPVTVKPPPPEVPFALE